VIAARDIENWQSYTGRTETRVQMLDVESARRFAAAVGADLDVERRPPPLAHWAYFLETLGPQQLGDDGHPLRGQGFVPPIGLPRRMFAASSMRFFGPLELGRAAELTLVVVGITHRVGRAGDLVFVEIDHQLRQDRTLRLSERRTLVFRGLDSVALPIAAAAPGDEAEESWLPTPTDLFRFSAATFNSHRIHYDVPYATQQEGYPGLVVHGPFTAAKLFAFAERQARASISEFTCRATAPLFVSQRVRLAPCGGLDEFNAIRCDGAVAMSARVKFFGADPA
jgi:3-methylfumaryl-CoA hydratase